MNDIDGFALPVGHRIREYEIVRVIARGGFAITYLASHRHLEEKSVLKEFAPRFVTSLARLADGTISVGVPEDRAEFETHRQRFLDESRKLQRFQSPHVVPIKDTFEENGTAYHVMPFVEGPTLKARVDNDGPRSLAEILELLTPIADVLDRMHATGFVHRDVKPDNIILAPSGAVLIDFGIAKYFVPDPADVTLVHTPGFSPPEQYLDRAGFGDTALRQMSLGPTSDVYALARTVCFCLIGARFRRVWDSAGALEAALGEVVNDDQLLALKSAMADLPGKRTGSATELFLRLGGKRAAPSGRVRRTVFIAGVALVLGLGSYYGLRNDAPRSPPPTPAGFASAGEHAPTADGVPRPLFQTLVFDDVPGTNEVLNIVRPVAPGVNFADLSAEILTMPDDVRVQLLDGTAPVSAGQRLGVDRLQLLRVKFDTDGCGGTTSFTYRFWHNRAASHSARVDIVRNPTKCARGLVGSTEQK